mgnify:CR=1 FL=1
MINCSIHNDQKLLLSTSRIGRKPFNFRRRLYYPYGIPAPDLYRINAKFEILSEDHIPENIPGRESPIKQLQWGKHNIRKKFINIYLCDTSRSGGG